MSTDQLPAEPPAPSGCRSGTGLGACLLAFLAFVVLNVAAPQTMAATTLYLGPERELTLAGLNVACIFGAGLVLAAIGLALAEIPRKS